jgi:hypothetical protein
MPQTVGDVQVFNANSRIAGEAWATWTKRRGVSMVHMTCIGGACAGGNGAIGANGLGGGGGGGGSANVSFLTIPAILLPDQLLVSVGYGGVAATSGTPASGIASYIAVQKLTSAGAGILAQHSFLMANASAGAAGMNASGGTAGAAGAQIAADTSASCSLCNLGTPTFIRGLAGTVGGTSATTATVGGVLAYTTGMGITMPGTGGGGVHQTAANNGLAGGLITALANSVFFGQPASAGGTNAALAAHGNHGYQTFTGMLSFTGATGGGAGYSAAGAFIAGGRGGNGAIGGGGGGSGGSFTGATAPMPGNGGDGLVIITSW